MVHEVGHPACIFKYNSHVHVGVLFADELVSQGCLELGCVPEGVAWKLDLTPVDFAARAVVQVTVHQPQKALGKVCRLENNLLIVDGNI